MLHKLMKVKEVAFFSYAINDVKAARNFYEKILGLKVGHVFEKGDMVFIEYDISGVAFAIGKGSGNFKPGVPGGCVTLEMENFNEAVKELKAAKVNFVLGPMETPVCHMAIVTDPDGNQLMIHKRK
jgi:predicted enzyme related to lactoylglutathione lyase